MESVTLCEAKKEDSEEAYEEITVGDWAYMGVTNTLVGIVTIPIGIVVILLGAK
jgi:hypothetical protein